MSSIRSHIVSSILVKRLMKPELDLDKNTIEQIRQKSRTFSKKIILPRGTIIEKDNINGLPAEWIFTDKVSINSKNVVLYFHSGGFCLEYSNNHRELAARVSLAGRVRVLAIDYRLAPENQYPAANEDCLKAYQWLLEKGISPQNIIIGGDSAGGGLTIMTLLSLRDMGVPLPAAAFMLSPLGADLIKFDGESYQEKADLDPLNTLECIKAYANYYLGSTGLKPPIAIEQDLHGLPNLLIQVGSNEVILSDSIRLAERAKAAGVNVELEIWENMWHVFQGFAFAVPEARRAIKAIGNFVIKNLK